MAAHDSLKKPSRKQSKATETYEEKQDRLRDEHRAEMASLVKDVAPHNHGDELDITSDAYKNKHKG